MRFLSEFQSQTSQTGLRTCTAMARNYAPSEDRPWGYLLPLTGLAREHFQKSVPLTLAETVVGRTVKEGPGSVRLENVLQGAERKPRGWPIPTCTQQKETGRIVTPATLYGPNPAPSIG